MNTLVSATNATKGIVTGALILVVEGIQEFGIYDFTDGQKSWTQRAIALIGVAWIALTKTWSRKRVPDSFGP